MKSYVTALCLLLGAIAIIVGLSGCGQNEAAINVETTVTTPAPAVAPVQCDVYDLGAYPSTMPNFSVISPAVSIGLNSMTLTAQSDDSRPFTEFVGTSAAYLTKRFGLRCKLTYSAPLDGNYVIKLGSDDGSALYLNGIRVINAPNTQGYTVKSTTQNLLKGKHTIIVDYFEADGPKALTLTVQQPAAPVTTL